MAELKNQPPSTPVAAASRPPPDSTDAQKDAALETIRKSRAQMPGRKPYEAGQKEQTVSVMVNNGTHGGTYAIGRYFPNGLTNDVSVTDDELAELKAEPQEIIRVATADDMARGTGPGKESSASSAPALADDERQALEAYRRAKAAGQGEAFLAQAQKSGGETGSDASSSSASSTDSAAEARRRR